MRASDQRGPDMAKRDNIRRAIARARVGRRIDAGGLARPGWWRTASEDWERTRALRAAQADRAGLDVADDLLPKPGAHYREQAARGILDRFGAGNA